MCVLCMYVHSYVCLRLCAHVTVLSLIVKRHLTGNVQLLIFNGRMFQPEGLCQLLTRCPAVEYSLLFIACQVTVCYQYQRNSEPL